MPYKRKHVTELETKSLANDSGAGVRRSRRATGDENQFEVFEQNIYLEVLVVVDKAMSKYYGKEKLHDYILTIMSMVLVITIRLYLPSVSYVCCVERHPKYTSTRV